MPAETRPWSGGFGLRLRSLMASALLASRIGPSWGDREVYMRKYPSNSAADHDFIANPNPSPAASRQRIHDRVGMDDEAASFAPSRSSRFDASEYVTFSLGDFSRSDLRDLKRRLKAELEQVRILRSRLETASYESRPAYPASQFSATSRRSPDAVADSPRPKISGKAGANKKGVKRTSAFGSAKEPKNPSPALPPSLDPVTERLVPSIMKRCAQILGKLMKHKHSWVFNTPVDAANLGLHDYHLIIKNPMDLGTVKSKLDREFYRTPQDFAADVRLTFNNALLYNPKGTDVHLMAETLLTQFDQMFDPAYKKFEKERQRALGAAAESQPPPDTWAEEVSILESVQRDPEPIPVERNHNVNQNSNLSPMRSPPGAFYSQEQAVEATAAPSSGGKRAKVGKLPKPKAKDLNKRDMTLEEKAKLGMNLQNLPPEKMGQLVSIIRQRNKQFAEDGDEIELDIEAVDIETLWELDRFVCNYKKLASKIKRQGLIHNQVSASEITHKSPVGEAPEDALLTLKGRRGGGETGGGGGEEDVDIGDEMPMGNYPPVEIERDDARSNTSSSSSSSGDSSSSSDSDSQSSGSKSDAESVQTPFVGSKGGGDV